MKTAPDNTCSSCYHFVQVPNDYESKFGVCMLDKPIPECMFKSLKKANIRYDDLFRVLNSHKCGKHCYFWEPTRDHQ